MFNLNLFKRRPLPKEEIDKRNYIRLHGSKLRHLKDSLEWADLLLVKDWAQHNAAMTSVSPLVTDKDRFQAAVQYTTIDGFFNEISRRIQAGEKAAQELADRAGD